MAIEFNIVLTAGFCLQADILFSVDGRPRRGRAGAAWRSLSGYAERPGAAMSGLSWRVGQKVG